MSQKRNYKKIGITLPPDIYEIVKEVEEERLIPGARSVSAVISVMIKDWYDDNIAYDFKGKPAYKHAKPSSADAYTRDDYDDEY